MLAAADRPYDLATKLAFLSRRASYAEPTAHIEAIETHMSWVFLTDRHAYKLKKPVRHAFLDFSTLEARRRDCEAELRLNRRLAPEVYLEVVALTAEPSGALALAGAGPPVEWLVKMKRLPRDRMLDAAIARGDVRDSEIAAVADLLAAFYRGLPPIALDGAAYRNRLARDIEACRTELRAPAHELPAALFESAAVALLAFVARESSLLDARVAAGRIVEGHGDLRPEHVCLLDTPVIIDCLEFNPDFRILDVADELAFLALECARLGAPDTGEKIVAACAARLADRVPPPLHRFYFSYRALVRAKIAAWHAHDVPAAEIGKWRARTRRYLALATHAAQAGA
jgi:aminoglycoside phosphotransferase family enzyme